MLTCQKPVNQSFNTNVYQLLGDPLLSIYGPERLNNIILEHTNGEDTDNFQARETVAAQVLLHTVVMARQRYLCLIASVVIMWCQSWQVFM